MGAAAPKPPLAIPPHSKLWGFLAFSHEIVQELELLDLTCGKQKPRIGLGYYPARFIRRMLSSYYYPQQDEYNLNGS